ncbi:short-chain fatty acid transporter [Beijerinckia sp. L45]|uniref:short-chain fatty acid transporter n=1 Tax=Beijerinckia sp. L45 TaxID=1641855 RepID=UPI001AED145C|nr:TIGR00366 family protein [Beijerinckia sp. L45]
MEVAAVRPPRRGMVSFFVTLFERFMPDPFALAIGLTFVVGVLAFAIAPKGDLKTILSAWYAGCFNILAFAFQMTLILVTGHALATATPVRRVLRRLVSVVSTPSQAIILMFAVVSSAAWLNWGLGLVVGAFLAREIAGRIRVDYGWLVAAAYSAWSVCNSGLSSSIALSQASHGSSLNVVEKLTGHILPMTQTVFTTFTMLPTIAVVVVMCVIFIRIQPAADDVIPLAEDAPGSSIEHRRDRGEATTFAGSFESSSLGTIFIVAVGAAAIGFEWWEKGASLELNTLILLFLLAGMALQRTPIAYADAVREAARQTGSILLQFPFYGGIMGIMVATGLAGLISQFFVGIATASTLPAWSYLSSLIITFLVPSAGGHWAVQGPFVIPAAQALKASIPATAMAVAMAENVANMLQPFWAVPLIAIAGIGIQRVLGYTIITFLVSLVIYGLAVLFLTI